MPAAEPTWIVLSRDVSHAVRVKDVPRLVASLVLDADTGYAQGISVASTRSAACSEAMKIALTKPVGPLAARAPAQVLCGPGQAGEVAGELTRLLGGGAAPKIIEVEPTSEAEDIFDSLVGHMAGRRQPEELPEAPDWQMLFSHANTYCQAEPWLRWGDDADMDLVVRVAGTPSRYVAVVIGQEGFQRGLVLYPGGALPEGLRFWEPGVKVSLPAGTLLMFLDPLGDVPPEFSAKAIRYGWSADAELFPSWVAGGPDGLSDLDRRGAQRLTVALAAMVAHDQRHATGHHGKTTGEFTLADGEQGSFTVG